MIRIKKLEGHYTIKMIDRLPKKGNANWLYSLEKDNLSIFYRWNLDEEFEKIEVTGKTDQNNKGVEVEILNQGSIISEQVNILPNFTIESDEIYIFHNEFSLLGNDNNLIIYRNTYIFKKGQGNYGLNSGIVLVEDDFALFNSNIVSNITIVGGQTPVVEYITALSIDDPANAVNTSLQSYNVIANRDTYFVIQDISNSTPRPSKTYRFVGIDGVYGSGNTQTVLTDFLLVEDNSNTNTPPLSLIAANVSYFNGSITNVQEALDLLLYITPDISNFNITPNLVEIGTTVNAVSLSWALNKPFIDLSINNGVGVIAPSLTSLNIPSLSLVANTTYTITGGDGINTDAASATLNFRAKRWYGTSPLATFTGADILNLQNSELSTNRQQVRTFNGSGQYMWFAFPVSYGLPTFVVNGLPSTAFVTETVSHTNQSGHTQNYYVTRTTTVQNGTLTIQIL